MSESGGTLPDHAPERCLAEDAPGGSLGHQLLPNNPKQTSTTSS